MDHFGSGVKRVLSNSNILNIGIKADLSSTHFIQGSYEINIPGEPLTKGSYTLSGSYIGITASYCFTEINKKRVRVYKKRGQKCKQKIWTLYQHGYFVLTGHILRF